jgi:hypothetical protein
MIRHHIRRLGKLGVAVYSSRPGSSARTRELVGFQRWVVRRADLMVPWEEYRSANCRGERLQRPVDHPTVSPIVLGGDEKVYSCRVPAPAFNGLIGASVYRGS